MAIRLTDRTLNVLQRVNIQPQYVLEIDGIDTLYTATLISKVVQVGDPGLLIGGDWVIGGFTAIEDQSDTISLSVNSTEISQQLEPSKGAISSISSMKLTLVDINAAATELITPGILVEDLLARRCRVWIGFDGTSYPEDFTTVFRGIIDDIESEQGAISLNISHPDQKKRNTIFERGETQVDDATLDNSETTINVVSTTDFLAPVNGPNGANDTSLKFYIKIDDEIIRYTGKTATSFTGCTRGSLGTVADSHQDDADVTSFYTLSGNAIDLALKVMLSGWNGPFEEDVEITNFVIVDGTAIANAIFFEDVNVMEKYGLNEGDYITTTGAANGANNVSLKQISTIEITDSGSYIIIDGVTFVNETATAGIIDFRSQYDTLGEGLKMHGDEVDVEAHLLWYNRYLSSFDYEFYLKDTIEGKEFIEQQIYLPAGGYSLPRKSRASMGYHSSPIPTETITLINVDNVTNPHQLKVRRSLGKNFYNTIIYKFDEDVLEDKFLSGHIETDATSKSRIAVGNKSLIIESSGMRRLLGAESDANLIATRLLNRYKFAAEYMDNVKMLFSEGFSVEVGDIVLFDGSELNISDTTTGLRGAAPRLMEVINKKLNLKTGEVTLSLVDTNFSTSNRYGLISPASKVESGTSGTVFVIKESFSGTYGANEYRKWDRYIGCSVKVRNSDFSVSGVALIQGVVGNTITLASSLGFTPAANYIMELSDYDDQPDIIKLLYTFMTDNATFGDGKDQYKMI